MSNGSTFVRLQCWANNVRQFDISLKPYPWLISCATVVLTWIPEAPENGKSGISGSARHPFVLCIQSEASIPILGYSVIGQILTGDPHFYNTMFWLHFK